MQTWCIVTPARCGFLDFEAVSHIYKLEIEPSIFMSKSDTTAKHFVLDSIQKAVFTNEPELFLRFFGVSIMCKDALLFCYDIDMFIFISLRMVTRCQYVQHIFI